MVEENNLLNTNRDLGQSFEPKESWLHYDRPELFEKLMNTQSVHIFVSKVDGEESVWPKVARIFCFMAFVAVSVTELMTGTTWFVNLCTLTLWTYWITQFYFLLATINMFCNCSPKVALLVWQIAFSLSVPVTLLFWTCLWP